MTPSQARQLQQHAAATHLMVSALIRMMPCDWPGFGEIADLEDVLTDLGARCETELAAAAEDRREAVAQMGAVERSRAYAAGMQRECVR